jgi:CRP-like cAMP-binding protein
MLDINNEMKKLMIKYPDLWKKHSHKRNTLLLTAGEIATKNFYVESGILKAYVYNEDLDKNVVVYFFANGEFILPYKKSCSEIIPTMVYIETIENSIIHSINSNDWENLKEKEPILDELIYYDFVRLLKKFIIMAQINAYPDAQTRYDKACEFYPALCRISNVEVASFFGNDRSTINREKSSSIKKKIKK